MIHLYGICYWITKYPQLTLESLIKNASEPFKLTVVEGRSDHSPEMLQWAQNELKTGSINTFIQASANCKGAGLLWAFDNLPPDDSEDFCMFTDLDLIVPDGCDWIGESRKAMQEGVVSGFQLSDANYVPPNWGWHLDEPNFGNWLMSVKLDPFRKFPRAYNFQDHIVLNHMRGYGKQIQIKHRLYHLGWDAWKDDPEYWARKTGDMNWQSRQSCTYEIFTAST